MKIVVLFAVMMAVTLCYAHYKGYRLNVTPSLAKGVYRLSNELPERGDIVSFCISGAWADLAKERGYLQSGSCPSGLRPLMKHLAAIPNDKLEYAQNGLSCVFPDGLGCFWPVKPKKIDSRGRPVEAASISGIVPDGKAVVLTMHGGGFDSRYFGFVPLESLQKVIPILTF